MYIYLQVAICYYHMFNYSKSYSVFERAVEYAQLANTKDLECIAITNMAVVEHCLLRSKVLIHATMPSHMSLTPHVMAVTIRLLLIDLQKA